MNKLLSLLLLLTLVKGIVYSIIVPLWEFPDEQAHFANLSYLIETGTPYSQLDLSREIYEAEKVMGTVRDLRGVNNYTYRPDFRPAYKPNSVDGIYEDYVENMPREWRTEYVAIEAARYPKLFYWLSSIGYRVVYHQDVFARVFSTRMISVGLTMACVYGAYLIGRKIFEQHELYALTLATAVSFHPMFSFVSSGINNDNGINLIGMIIFLLAISVYQEGLSIRRSLILGVTAGLGVLTKPLVAPLIMAVGLVILLEWRKSKRALKHELKLLMPLVLGGICAGGWLLLKPLILYGRLPYITYAKDLGQDQVGVFSYLVDQLKRYYRETLVWYWGVYKWLGVILPLNLIRLIKVGMIVSLVGLLKEIIKPTIVKHKWKLGLSILFAITFVVMITLWDYDNVRKNGFSHGLQGRYFFSTLSSHLVLLIVGWLAIVPKGWRDMLAKTIILGFISLQSISWYTLLNAYYDVRPLRVLFEQMSQYKPEFLKYPWSLIFFLVYIFMLVLFIVAVLRYNRSVLVHQLNKKKI